jgi:hypothetical protein
VKKTHKIVSSLALIILFLGCKKYDGYKISELYAQKIEGSSKIIYKYDAWGGRDSNINGYAVFDSTETFELSKIKELPISILLATPNRNLIYAIEETYDIGKNSKPIESYNIKEQGLEIKIKKYSNFSDRTILQGRFVFDSFKETRDSLFFYNLDDTISATPEHLNCLRFKKINIYVSQDKNKEISQITIDDIELSKDTIISQKTYFLYPKRKLTLDKFSDYGIFKDKK